MAVGSGGKSSNAAFKEGKVDVSMEGSLGEPSPSLLVMQPGDLSFSTGLPEASNYKAKAHVGSREGIEPSDSLHG
eukprot:1897689-Amphidinium_carterae.1